MWKPSSGPRFQYLKSEKNAMRPRTPIVTKSRRTFARTPTSGPTPDVLIAPPSLLPESVVSPSC